MKLNKIIAITFFVFFAFPFFSQTNLQPKTGKQIYDSNCARCHGDDGTRSKLGAKNLQLSKMTDTDILLIITNGKKNMPASKKKLTIDEIALVKNYIITLRK